MEGSRQKLEQVREYVLRARARRGIAESQLSTEPRPEGSGEMAREFEFFVEGQLMLTHEGFGSWKSLNDVDILNGAFDYVRFAALEVERAQSQKPVNPPFPEREYVFRIHKPWGFELHLVSNDAPYMVKLLHIHSGARLSLQRHLPGTTSPAKLETWVLLDGHAKVVWEDADGHLVETELEAGRGYTAPAGLRHRLVGITDCEILEASTPEGDGTTERLDDDYRRPDETAEMRRQGDRGWRS